MQQSGVQLVAQDQPAFMAALAAANGAVQALGVGAGGAAQKIDQLTTRVDFQKRQLGILTQELTATSAKYGEGSIQAQKKQLAVDKLTASIAKDEAALAQLKQQEAQAAQTSAQLEQGLTKAGQSGSKFGQVMTGALRAVGEFAVNMLGRAAQAVIGFVSGSEQAAEKYQKTMSEIVGLTGTSASEVSHLSEEVLKLGPAVGKGPQELGDALYYVLSSGVDAAHAMDVVEASAKAAAAGLGETQTVADLVTSVMNAYGAANITAAGATDILTQAVKDGKGEPDAYAQALGRVLPIAAAAGVSFQQVAASIATMTRTGLDANEATTALRGIIGSLEAPTEKTRGALHDLGLSADDVRKAIREQGLLSALQMLMERSHGNLDVLGALVPNIRALTGVLSTVGSQSEAYTEILGHMNTAQGATDRAFQQATNTIDFQKKAFGAAMESLQITIGSVALPALASFLKEGLVPMVQHLTEFIKQTKDGQTWLAQLAGTVQTTVLPALAGLTAATALYAFTNLPAMIAALGTATTALMTNAAAMTAALVPYALVAVAVGGMVLAWQKYEAELDRVTQKVLNSSQAWRDGTAALETYHNSAPWMQQQLRTEAEGLEALRAKQEALVKAYGEDVAAREQLGQWSGIRDEQLTRERDEINALGAQITTATQQLQTHTSALSEDNLHSYDQIEAIRAARGAIVEHTDALGGNIQQQQLSEEEAKKLAKEIDKAYKDGTSAVEAYVNAALDFHARLTQAVKSGNAEEAQAVAKNYAEQAAAARASIGQQLIDYTIAWGRMNNVSEDRLSAIVGQIEQRFGQVGSISATTFLGMERDIRSAAQDGGAAIDNLGQHLDSATDEAITLKEKADALKGKYEMELMQNFKDGKIDADQLRRSLEGIPARVYSEIYVTTHRREVAEGGGVNGPQQRQHGGPVALGQPYLVGERGPEMFVPQQSGYIVPNHRIAPPASAAQIINVPPPQVIMVQPASTTNVVNNNTFGGGGGSRSVLGGHAAAAAYGTRG